MRLVAKVPILCALAMTAGPASSEDVSFPAGDFETNPSSNWTTTGSVSFPDSGGNSFARIAPVVTGSGSLVSTVPATFADDSLYVVSVDIASTNLLALGSDSFQLEILDGSDQVVAEITQAQLVGLLGLDLSLVNDLTVDLNLLDGLLSDELSILTRLRDLLDELSLADNGALILAVEELVASLVGQDQSVVTEVVSLLEGVAEGSLDPGSLDNLDIADLLNLDPSNPIVQDVADLLAFATGNEGPVEKLAAVLELLLGTDGDLADLTIISDLLGTLNGEDDLTEIVADILNLSLVEDILGTLTTGDVTGLLGFLNTGSTNFQTVKLLFTTDVAPTGNLKVRLSGSALVTVGYQVDFDNVAIERFDLVATPDPTDPDISINNTRPLIRAQRERVIRTTNKARLRIRGTARAFGEDNSIRKIEVAVRGKGTRPSDRKFKSKGVRGTTNWTARVRIPVGDRTRVLFKATDATGKTSVTSLVRVKRS